MHTDNTGADTRLDQIRTAIRDVLDFPKPGIVFKDITPVLADAGLLRATIDVLSERHRHSRIDRIAAIDARGFLLGAAVADRLGAGLILIRKQGKLPYTTFDQSYDLEYGTGTLSMHTDAVRPGDRILLIDDLLATGGSAAAAAHLLEKGGGLIAEIEFLVELSFLEGRKRLSGYPVFSAIMY